MRKKYGAIKKLIFFNIILSILDFFLLLLVMLFLLIFFHSFLVSVLFFIALFIGITLTTIAIALFHGKQNSKEARNQCANPIQNQSKEIKKDNFCYCIFGRAKIWEAIEKKNYIYFAILLKL